MIEQIEWDDVAVVMCRMKGRQLLEVQAKPGSMPGHILTIAATARAQRRGTKWHGVGAVIDYYCKFKGIPWAVLVGRIEEYWRDCGHWPKSAEAIIEELSKE